MVELIVVFIFVVLSSILYFKRKSLFRKCYLYMLERKRATTKHYHEHMDVERIRQGKVYLKDHMETVPTKLGLAVPFIVKEDVVFIRRTEFIQARDKLMGEIKELLKKCKQNLKTTYVFI